MGCLIESTGIDSTGALVSRTASADTKPGGASFNRHKACRYGAMLYNGHDTYVGRSLELYGEFSEGEIAVFRQLIRRGDVVLDVGANIGTHTLFFSRQVGPAGRVLAFEAQRIVFQTLCGNMALNSVSNAWCYPHALGAAPGSLVVPPVDYSQEDNFGGVSLGEYKRGERVSLITLDSVGLERCHFIKIDVEGMEQAVLAGAARTIARLRPILYVENDREDRAAELIRFIDGLGYAMYWHRPRLFNPKNYFGNATNVFGNLCSINMLCLHRSAKVSLRGFESVKVPY